LIAQLRNEIFIRDQLTDKKQKLLKEDKEQKKHKTIAKQVSNNNVEKV